MGATYPNKYTSPTLTIKLHSSETLGIRKLCLFTDALSIRFNEVAHLI